MKIIQTTIIILLIILFTLNIIVICEIDHHLILIEQNIEQLKKIKKG